MRFFKGINALDDLQNESAALKECGTTILICRVELIPSSLLPSRACFRFSSTQQNSIKKIIFTTCKIFQPRSPPAWVRIRGQDFNEPNPEISYIMVDSTVSEGGTFMVSDSVALRCYGYSPYYLVYAFGHTDWTLGPWNFTYIQSPIPFDTIDFVIEY